MAEDDWTRCEICGNRMKTDRLPQHKDEVHPEGAETEAERERVEARRERRRRINLGALAAIGVASLVVGGWALTQLGGPTETTLSPDEEPRVGEREANLTVYLFEDYQCPHCAAFETDGGFEHLRSTWVETGDVRVVYKDFAFIGADSRTTAEASQCVWEHEPDAWHAWHTLILENQGAEGSGWAARDNIEQLTRDWGQIDMDAFTSCLDSGRYFDEVRGDREEGEANGVSGTPALVVGNRVINAQDTDAMDDAIQATLEADR
jgi:protein-disulfide isomerase